MKKFDQYVSHLRILSRAFDEDLTNDFIVSGIIDKYYIQFELGWKVLKELLRYEGANQAATGSPREIIKTAYAYYDFIDEIRVMTFDKKTKEVTVNQVNAFCEFVDAVNITEFDFTKLEVDGRENSPEKPIVALKPDLQKKMEEPEGS